MLTISRSGFQPKSRWRLALIVGFGALVAVTIAGAADMWLTLRQIHARSASVLNDYMRRDKILERVRTNAYLSTTLLRDFVLDPRPLACANSPGRSASIPRRTGSGDIGLHPARRK